MIPPLRIDLHHHILPPAVIQSFQRLGFEGVGGVPFPAFDLPQTLDMLAEQGIERAVVSLADVGPTFQEKHNALHISQQYNDLLAELCRQHPGQFGAFATLPLPHLAASLAELTRAYDELGLHGVMLPSNSQGFYPGDAQFDPLLEALNQRKATVFVHPTAPGAMPTHLQLPSFLLEFAFETARAGANLLLSNVPTRFPDIKFILAHAGGTLPYLVSRLILGQTNLAALQNVHAASPLGSGVLVQQALARAASIRSGLGSFYYDTALSSVPEVLSLPASLAGTERLVYGTDFPFVRGAALTVAEHFFEQQPFDAAQRQNIVRANALRLFPQWAGV